MRISDWSSDVCSSDLKDALVIGLFDLDPANNALPLLTNPTNGYPHGRPSVNISGTNGFCTLERSEEHTSELKSLTRMSYAVFCLTTKISSTNDTLKSNTRRNDTRI